jgi:hypothetical protein
LFFSSLPNLLEVVQRARPSFNPKGTCPCWADSPAAPGGPKRRTRQFHSTREGGKCLAKCLCRTWLPHLQSVSCTRKVSVALGCRTRTHLQMLIRDFSCFFLTFLFNSSLPNLLEVVQRARPSFNPKGTCLRWAESPAAPGGPKRRTQQFHSTREGGKSLGWLAKCLSHSFFANVLCIAAVVLA